MRRSTGLKKTNKLTQACGVSSCGKCHTLSLVREHSKGDVHLVLHWVVPAEDEYFSDPSELASDEDDNFGLSELASDEDDYFVPSKFAIPGQKEQFLRLLCEIDSLTETFEGITSPENCQILKTELNADSLEEAFSSFDGVQKEVALMVLQQVFPSRRIEQDCKH